MWLLCRACSGMLAPDGRCKTLDAAGDGYVRGEDCIVALLQALSAEGAGGGIPALLRGSAVKQVRLGACCPRDLSRGTDVRVLAVLSSWC